jgi:DNA-binding transcriptional regulator YbjK
MTRPWRVIAGLALILAASSVLLTAILFTKIQTERIRSLTSSCMRDSRQSAAIIGFLADVSPRTVDKARRFFPVYSQAECRRQADQLVGPPPAGTQ